MEQLPLAVPVIVESPNHQPLLLNERGFCSVNRIAFRRKRIGLVVVVVEGRFVGNDEVEAADKAHAAGCEGPFYFLRIGSRYTHRLMTPRR